MAQGGRSVTGVDVARAAGVSQAVVSLIFSGKSGSRVSKPTEERVRAAAHRLGYTPNLSASALKTGRVTTLALAVPVITQPFFSAVLQAAEIRARSLGYSMVLLSGQNDGDWATRLIGMLRSSQLAGAIVYGPTEAEAKRFAESGLDIVACELNGPGLPSVDVELVAGMTQAADHLIDCGHTEIGYLGTSHPHVSYRIRFEAFRRAVEERGGRLTAIERSPAAEFDAAVVSALRLLRRAPDSTAILCDDDLLAPAVVRAARTLGRSVPEDISIVGVGDIALARMLTPALTTVGIPIAELGATAVDELVSVLDGRHPTTRAVRANLIVRESVTSRGERA